MDEGVEGSEVGNEKKEEREANLCWLEMETDSERQLRQLRQRSQPARWRDKMKLSAFSSAKWPQMCPSYGQLAHFYGQK